MKGTIGHQKWIKNEYELLMVTHPVKFRVTFILGGFFKQE